MASLSQVETLANSNPTLRFPSEGLVFDQIEASKGTYELQDPSELVPSIVVVGKNADGTLTLTFFEVPESGLCCKYKSIVRGVEDAGSLIIDEVSRNSLSGHPHIPMDERDADGRSEDYKIELSAQ